MSLSSKVVADSVSVEKQSFAEGQQEKSQDAEAAVKDDFGGESSLPPPPILTEAQERKLYRKIDVRLMLILTLLYLCNSLDRGESHL